MRKRYRHNSLALKMFVGYFNFRSLLDIVFKWSNLVEVERYCLIKELYCSQLYLERSNNRSLHEAILLKKARGGTCLNLVYKVSLGFLL